MTIFCSNSLLATLLKSLMSPVCLSEELGRNWLERPPMLLILSAVKGAKEAAAAAVVVEDRSHDGRGRWPYYC